MKNNILIAEFMGWHHDTKYDLWYSPEMMKQKSMREATISFHFHSSWNELIPVIEKIKTLKYKVGLIKQYVPIIHGLGAINKEATYKAVVELIKWYKNK